MGRRRRRPVDVGHVLEHWPYLAEETNGLWGEKVSLGQRHPPPARSQERQPLRRHVRDRRGPQVRDDLPPSEGRYSLKAVRLDDGGSYRLGGYSDGRGGGGGGIGPPAPQEEGFVMTYESAAELARVGGEGLADPAEAYAQAVAVEAGVVG